MNYKEAEIFRNEQLKLVGTMGDDKFPFVIDKILILPANFDLYPNKGLEVIKWIVGVGMGNKEALESCEFTNEDLQVYLYSKDKKSTPILLWEYLLV
jgi:hypothetical protein